MQNIAHQNILNMVLYCLLDEINGHTQTGPRTSWKNADQLAKRKLVRGPGSGFLDTAGKWHIAAPEPISSPSAPAIKPVR